MLTLVEIQNTGNIIFVYVNTQVIVDIIEIHKSQLILLRDLRFKCYRSFQKQCHLRSMLQLCLPQSIPSPPVSRLTLSAEPDILTINQQTASQDRSQLFLYSKGHCLNGQHRSLYQISMFFPLKGIAFFVCTVFGVFFFFLTRKALKWP